MKISQAAALADVEIATRARQLADADADLAAIQQAAAIRAAADAGVRAVLIAERARISIRRVYQILGIESQDQ